ncbi:hypothetical protein HYC85_019891 [Camellia sinensis]|uniref:tRNA-binding domain-containing protein n=1 Tax=Camellia sinensis TaxID=4442 RepID=A0A7J7GN99_CAMSI|nr:hypothetical protein HYC85_019891 [Camellia sinensis]
MPMVGVNVLKGGSFLFFRSYGGGGRRPLLNNGILLLHLLRHLSQKHHHLHPSSSTVVGDGGGDEEKDEIKNAANTLDIRVGRIVRAWRHEEADSLYVEEVDIGEPQPRIICSGLVKYIPLDLLQDKKVVVFANLKPRNMRGIKSFGMLMAASDASHENVELLVPPEGSLPGDRIWFGCVDEKENLPDAASPNQIQKKKIWELVQPHLKTDASCVAALGGQHFMRTSAGLVVCTSLQNANVS